MGLSATPIGSNQAPCSAVALITQMRIELQDLAKQREEICRRIRSVRKLMRGLSQLRLSSVCATDSAPAACETVNAALMSHGATDTALGNSLCSAQAMQDDARLQRACRVALMEADCLATLDEISVRIQRRGSYSLESGITPALERALELMVERGEARVLQSSLCRGWQLMGHAKDA